MADAFTIGVDPEKLQSREPLFDEIRRYVDFVRSSRPIEPDNPVLLPGEIENRNRATRGKGLEVDDTIRSADRWALLSLLGASTSH